MKFLGSGKNIEPLDHRIKMVKELWWIKIYDDWICTSSQALNVALNSFNENNINSWRLW